jgi:hypothetical protein
MACRFARSFPYSWLGDLAVCAQAMLDNYGLGETVARAAFETNFQLRTGIIVGAAISGMTTEIYNIGETPLQGWVNWLNSEDSQITFGEYLYNAPVGAEWNLETINAFVSSIEFQGQSLELAGAMVYAAYGDDYDQFRAYSWARMAFPRSGDCAEYKTWEQAFEFVGGDNHGWALTEGNITEFGLQSREYDGVQKLDFRYSFAEAVTLTYARMEGVVINSTGHANFYVSDPTPRAILGQNITSTVSVREDTYDPPITDIDSMMIYGVDIVEEGLITIQRLTLRGKGLNPFV